MPRRNWPVFLKHPQLDVKIQVYNFFDIIKYGAAKNLGVGTLFSDGLMLEVIFLAIIAIGVVAIYISIKKQKSVN